MLDRTNFSVVQGDHFGGRNVASVHAYELKDEARQRL